MLKKIKNIIKEKPFQILFIFSLLSSFFIIFYVFIYQNEYFYITQRETQTAITSYYMKYEGYGLFNYITPIMGYPWAIPMEFPVFQYIVSVLSGIFFNINNTGRVLSFLFYLFSIFLMFQILKEIGFKKKVIFLYLSLYVTSPIFITYSFSFTIETTALLFSLLYFLFTIKYLKKRAFPLFAFTTLFGIIASLCKVTTWIVFAGVTAILITFYFWREYKEKEFNYNKIFDYLIIIIPLIIVFAWILYSDNIKAENPIGIEITSTALHSWNYGTLKQKLSISNWIYYLIRSFVGVFGLFGLILPFILIYKSIKKKIKIKVNKELFFLSILGFFIGPAIFTNLHFEHDYYIIPGSIFLIFTLFYILQNLKQNKIIIILLILSNLITGFLYLILKQINYFNPLNIAVAKTLKDLPKDNIIIVFGTTFDSFIPYHSQKKALQTNKTDYNDPDFRQAIKNIEDKKVGAIIMKGDKYSQISRLTANRFLFNKKFKVSNGVEIFFNKKNKQYFKFKTFNPKKYSRKKISLFLNSFNSGQNRLIISFNKKTLLSFIYYYKGNIYMFDFKNGFQIIHRKNLNLKPEKPVLKIDN